MALIMMIRTINIRTGYSIIHTVYTLTLAALDPPVLHILALISHSCQMSDCWHAKFCNETTDQVPQMLKGAACNVAETLTLGDIVDKQALNFSELI